MIDITEDDFEVIEQGGPAADAARRYSDTVEEPDPSAKAAKYTQLLLGLAPPAVVEERGDLIMLGWSKAEIGRALARARRPLN
jgi:hypothetical protein